VTALDQSQRGDGTGLFTLLCSHDTLRAPILLTELFHTPEGRRSPPLRLGRTVGTAIPGGLLNILNSCIEPKSWEKIPDC